MDDLALHDAAGLPAPGDIIKICGLLKLPPAGVISSTVEAWPTSQRPTQISTNGAKLSGKCPPPASPHLDDVTTKT
jgi:hypothetical protein